MATRHYDKDFKEVGIGSILRPESAQHLRLVVVDMDAETVVARDIRTGETKAINTEKYAVTSS